MKSSIIELSQATSVAGRRYVKWVIHEIHPSVEQFNKNGISWKEQYVNDNIASAKGMPICVEFLDWEKSEPFGHGVSGSKDGSPTFEHSTVVGVTENAFVDDVDVNGKSIRALVGEGYIYEQRYPNFVTWLKSKMFDGDFPETSVEICAKKESGNEVIIYESGWKEKGRVPMVFDYSGDCILGIDPADDNAVLLELNNHKEGSKKVKEELEKKIAELGKQVDDQNTELNQLREFKKAAETKSLIAELNSKISAYSVEEKAVVKEKIESFPSAPSAEKIAEIVSEINSAIVAKVIASRGEKNSTQNKNQEDIYGDIYEANTSTESVTNINDLY